MTVFIFLYFHESDSSFNGTWLMLCVDGGLFSRKEISAVGFDLSIELPGFLLLSLVESVINVAPLPSIGRFLSQAGRGITVWD